MGISVYSDLNYAGYIKTWKIMTEYIIIINGVVIVWHSQSHKKFTLSVTEDKYLAITEVRCGIISVR